MSALVGYWRITEVDDAWDLQDELDIEEPAHFEVNEAGRGELVFFLFSGSVDARFDGDRIEFTWEGQWELDDMCGRGTAELGSDSHLHVHLWIHFGDEMELRATRA